MILLLILGVICIGVSLAALISVINARRLRTSERLASIHEYGFAATDGGATIGMTAVRTRSQGS